MTFARPIAIALLALVACRDAGGNKQPPAPATAPAGSGAAGSGSAEVAAPAQEPVAAADKEAYVPAEFKAGMARWRDTGVYLDGKPIAFMSFGELPITLKPTWVKDKVSDNKPPGCPIEKCPGWRWSRQRFYKFTDYLKALGVDIRKIKMLHVYGPKFSQTIAVTAKDLLSPAADEFMFRFGSLTGGKAIPHVPGNFGNGKQPDKINGVMIYIERKPPIITRDGIELDGQEQSGVPYYGEPLRGGVRVYLDDRLATIIKRQELDGKKATTTPDGELHWSLADFLASRGVDTSKLVEGWVIRDERRAEKIPWSELQKMTFEAGAQAKGGVLLGDGKYRANAIALHTRAVQPSELPEFPPDEEN